MHMCVQLPELSPDEVRDVRDAQQATSDPSLTLLVLRCDGVSVNNVPVSRLDFARLRHSDDTAISSYDALHLSDENVDAWGQCLRLMPPQAAREGVYMWPSGTVWKYMGYRAQPPTFNDVRRVALSLQASGLNLLQQRAWVLPRVRSKHWDAVLIDFRSKQVVLVDSLWGSNKTVVRRACTILEVVSRVLNGQPFDFSEWACGSLGSLSPKQPDSFNCGMFVLLLARCMHHDVQLTRAWTAAQLDQWRDLVTLELMDSKIHTFLG